ncbi:radical SAM protein, partial [Mesorhizobium sp. M2A.F.Ca.ET.029.05.1.1]
MNIVLINPPHTAIGSRVPDDHLPPLGLLAIGGPLIDSGHQVRLVDAEFGPMSLAVLVDDALCGDPDLILIGHSGSTSAHPTALKIAEMIKARAPGVIVIYGGVFPTYHWRDILTATDVFDFIVRGEGEATATALVEAIEMRQPVGSVAGIAYRDDLGRPVATQAAMTIADLDAWRVGWELIDHRRYSYWGGKRAVVMQFSRGCPHLCNYCGQRGFWTRWRHRDPVKFAREIAWLHREHGVELVNLADENPTSSKKAWRAFLHAMIAENVPVLIVGSTRADDIVRDADILHLYRKAGVIRWLLGMENTDEATLSLIRKGGSTKSDREAIRLLRRHGILSMATWVAGFEDETLSDLWRGFRQLIAYDPDQIQ